MNARERGFLLLSSHLGNPDRKPLTIPQLRTLAQRMQGMEAPCTDRELREEDLAALGYSDQMCRRIIHLLSESDVLAYCIQESRRRGCVPVTRVSENYPVHLRRRLGLDSPGCLWARGDISLLSEPMIALVGSRELHEENRRFAWEVGRQAAMQGFVLVSGNARGADKTAQNSCLAAGGKVISVVADALWKHPLAKNILYLSEDGWEEAFSAQRALSRNRVIHALGLKTFVAQTRLEAGGTWVGTVNNLRRGWSEVYCYDDASEGMLRLEQMGANCITIQDLQSFYDLPQKEWSLFDR